jgi:hypothetical protein
VSVCSFVGIGPPTSSPASECVSPLDPKREEQQSLAGEVVVGPNPDDWKGKPGTGIICDVNCICFRLLPF